MGLQRKFPKPLGFGGDKFRKESSIRELGSKIAGGGEANGKGNEVTKKDHKDAPHHPFIIYSIPFQSEF